MEEAAGRLRQFLVTSANNLGLSDDWTTPISLLLEEVAKERDGLHKYLKFKCVATSDGPSEKVDGLVFTKARVHEKMPRLIRPTKVLLWKGSLDMEKEDKNSADHQTYTFLHRADINMVLVEDSISHECQSKLISRGGITAFQHMQHRLQRFPNVAYTCTSLECQNIIENLNDFNEKPLILLGGCESFTILLKGRSTAQLKLMKQILKTGYNLFRNELLSSNYFIVTLPPLKIIPWEMDGGQDVVTIREEEVSSYIAYSLQQVEVHDESSESRPKDPVFCQHRDNFLELRRDCNMTEPHYISSLSRCDRWDAKGGKSGAIFSKSRDTRLIIKEINQAEFESFDNFGPMYFQYMKEAKKTFLAKIYGLYKVALGQTKFIMVMENLNFNRVIAMQYDLKGLVHGRFAPHSAQVLLDQNFLSDMERLRLHINPYSKQQDLQTAIRKDTEFLSGVNVMDYSLLVGFDMEKREIVCGIIDYLAPYSMKKKLETVGKSLLLLGKETRPTVIRPREYKKRFVDFMVKHFLGEVSMREIVKELEQLLLKERDARLDAEKRLELTKKQPLRRWRSI